MPIRLKALSVLFCTVLAAGVALSDYRVFVDGRPVPLVEAPKPTKYWKGQMYDQYAQPYWAALVDAHGEVEVRVESAEHDLSQARIIPGVVTVGERRAEAVTFKAKVPFRVSVEPQSRYRSIAVIAREPDRDAPNREDPKVRYFATGRHHLDEPIRLGSNETLYLEAGAIVEAGVFASGTNIAMRGHGVLSGVPWAWKMGPQTQFVHFKEAKDVRVKDVTLLGPYHWSLVLENVERADVDGIAILGGRVINDDGIDICRSRDVTVRNSFFHVQDDNIAVKWWAEDVTVENCMFWADVARIIHIGGECDPLPRGMRRISVKNVDVLHQSICKPASGEPVIHINASNSMPVENIKIENVRIWSPENKDMLARIETVIVHEAKGWAWYDTAGYVDGITIKDVKYKLPVPPECGCVKILGHDAAHPVRNVSFYGINIKPTVETNEFVVAAQAVEVRQVFREERFTRGNVNLRRIQAADDADWIWIADGGPAKGEMDAVRFSKEFTCGGHAGRVTLPNDGRAVAPRPPQLEIDVSADERFVLFLDGREIARGPHKGLVNHWYYQSYRIDGLEPGTHRLEAVVYRMETVRPRGVLTAGKGGFLLKANGAYDAALTTGKGKWQAQRVTGTRMEGFGDSEGFGGSGQSVSAGTGFLDPAAATGAPCGVKVVRRRVVDNEYGVPREGWALFPTERPDQMSARRQPGSFKAGQPLYRAGTNVYYQAADAGFSLVAEMNALLREGKPVTIPAGTSARLVWDMGDYYCAYPILETSGGAGAEIRWGWAESLYNRAHDRADRGAFDGKRCAHAMRDTFRSDGRAKATFTSPWWRCGRWCEFEVKTADAPLTLTKLACDEVRYPLAARASFDCDDASLADVWRLCRRGLENCMHETYMDCPYFEQQMYPGDTRVVMLIANALSGDARLTRFGVGHFDYARRENGLVPMNSPCYLVQDSSTYSMCWVAMLGDHALWNGGKDFLKARLPGMRHTLHLLLNYANAEGLLENLPGWSFQDWVEGWDFFGNAPDGRLGLSAVNNLLCVYALDSAIRVEEYAGDKLMADYWRARKKVLAEAVVSRFWDELRGMISDTVAHDRFSEHAQCLALLSDILPPDRARRALEGLLESTDLARTTVYFSHYLFDVYLKYGHADRFLKRLDLWRGYVKMGLKTPLEAPGVRARSDCHAWGSHPIYHLLTGVAGIKPTANGFAAVRIAPQPGGLKWLRATMPTPKGDIVLDLRFNGDAVSGTVTVPDALPGTFVWQGAERPLHAGVNTIPLR